MTPTIFSAIPMHHPEQSRGRCNTVCCVYHISSLELMDQTHTNRHGQMAWLLHDDSCRYLPVTHTGYVSTYLQHSSHAYASSIESRPRVAHDLLCIPPYRRLHGVNFTVTVDKCPVQRSEDVIKADAALGRSWVRFRVPPWVSEHSCTRPPRLAQEEAL